MSDACHFTDLIPERAWNPESKPHATESCPLGFGHPCPVHQPATVVTVVTVSNVTHPHGHRCAHGHPCPVHCSDSHPHGCAECLADPAADGHDRAIGRGPADQRLSLDGAQSRG